jgi:hypothetical protein
MRGLILGGLGLALGCLAAHARAEEPVWRPAAPRPAVIAQTGASAPSATPDPAPLVSLRQPTPLPAALTADPGPIFRAKIGTDVGQPLPTGPVLQGEQLPMPKDQPTPTPAPSQDTPPPNPWGGQIRPYTGFVPSPDGAAGPHGPVPDGLADGGPAGPDCGPACGPGDCCPEMCCPGDNCGVPHVYFSAEYLLWRMRSAPLPPLVTTTGSLTAAELVALQGANPSFRPGALGQIGTQTIFGGSDLDLGTFSGGRFTIGVGIAQTLGFEGTVFFLGKHTETFSAGSNGTVGIFRPFTNVTAGGQDAEGVSFPGLTAGSVNVNYNTRLWGAEGNLRYPLLCECNYKLDILAGFRFLDLQESLNISESVTFLVSNAALGVAAGDNIQVFDGFGTINHFYGGQLGADFQYKSGPWIFGVTPKLALGDMHQVVNINGSTVFSPAAGGVTTVSGGLLAASTNIGHHTSDRFAVVPEIGLKIGYQVTDHLQVYAGYDFLYVSSVVRPGDQVDLNVNTTQIPRLSGVGARLVGPAQPAVLFNRTDFWAQGVNFGLQFTY